MYFHSKLAWPPATGKRQSSRIYGYVYGWFTPYPYTETVYLEASIIIIIIIIIVIITSLFVFLGKLGWRSNEDSKKQIFSQSEARPSDG